MDFIAGRTTLDEVEKQAVEETLRLFNGVREKTAIALGVSRRTVFNLIKKHGIDIPSEHTLQKKAAKG